MRVQENRAIARTIVLQQLLQRISLAEQCPVIEKARGGSSNLETVSQGIAQPQRLTLMLELGIRLQRQSFDQCSDDRRIIARSDPESISRLIDQPRPLERELDMAGFLGRSAPDEGDIVDDRSGKWIALVMDYRRRSWRGRGGRGNRGWLCIRAELLNDRLGPSFGSFLVIDIAIYASREALSTELL